MVGVVVVVVVVDAVVAVVVVVVVGVVAVSVVSVLGVDTGVCVPSTDEDSSSIGSDVTILGFFFSPGSSPKNK